VITNYVLFIGLRICSYDIVIEKKNRAVTMFRLTSMHDSFFFLKAPDNRVFNKDNSTYYSVSRKRKEHMNTCMLKVTVSSWKG
jgi:hypothetical protein